MKISIALVALLATSCLMVGCGDGSDRPSPTGAELKAQDDQRKSSIDNNPAIPPEARQRIKDTMNSGKR